MIGMTHEFKPKFLRQYLNLYDEITKAVGQYVADVKALISQMRMNNIKSIQINKHFSFEYS